MQNALETLYYNAVIAFILQHSSAFKVERCATNNMIFTWMFQVYYILCPAKHKESAEKNMDGRAEISKGNESSWEVVTREMYVAQSHWKSVQNGKSADH